MGERTERELSGMFAAYREYGAAKREATRIAVPTLLGGVLAAGVVAVGDGSLVACGAAAVGMALLLVLRAGSIERRAAARARLDVILDKKKLSEAGEKAE